MVTACSFFEGENNSEFVNKAKPMEIPTKPVPAIRLTPPSLLGNTIEPISTSDPTITASPLITISLTPTPNIFVGAGDIAICGQQGDDRTAELVKQIGGEVFTAGDNVYGEATLYEYTYCFGPSWGQFLGKLHPVPGNHDYASDPLDNYYFYFGEAAGPAGKGYYSFDIGDWHIVMLNSNCSYVPCGPSSEQVAWLKQDLAENNKLCNLAIWHHPRWTSGLSGNAHWVFAFWDALYDAGVDVVVNGNDHHYERFAPMNPAGELDKDHGIREFIAGTGGSSNRGFLSVMDNSEKRIVGEFGVLKFTLSDESYEWEFINLDGEIMDRGSDICHP